MFGMGFTEILLIAVMAIIFIGPDKLPSMMVDIAKFFRNVKNTIGTVKESIEQELDVSDIKREALAYKEELLSAKEGLEKATDIQGSIASGLSDLNEDILGTDNELSPKATKEPEKVTFSKKSKKKKSKKEDKVDA